MKLGELFIELGIVGDIKPLKQALSGMDAATAKQNLLIKYKKDLAKATNDEERALVKKNFAQKINNLRMAQTASAALGVAKALTKTVAVITTAVVAFDRIANAAYKANQRMISFQRQTGISFATLNKYASASAAVNYNSSPEAVAQSLQNVASNLWDIRMGRGDVSPYQELAFVGGKAINVWGKSVEQVIEELRESLKGVSDLQATNLITRMGFSPDDLLMLRMTREEFQQIQSMFLGGEDQERLYQLGLELKKVHLELDLIYKRVLLKVLPAFNAFMSGTTKVIKVLADFVDRITSSRLGIVFLISMVGALAFSLRGILVPAILGVGKALWALLAANPAIMALVAALSALMLLLDDYIVWSRGGESFFNWSPPAPYKSTAEDSKTPFMKKHPFLSGAWASNTPWGRAGEVTGNWIADKIMGNWQPVQVPAAITTTNTVSQNNNINVHTSEALQAILGEMPTLESQLKTSIDQNIGAGW